jgi:hypothetical protein
VPDNDPHQNAPHLQDRLGVAASGYLPPVTQHERVAADQLAGLAAADQGAARRFLHELDDVKDHVPDRTVDMSYLVYRELLLPFDQWADNLQSVRNQFAGRYKLPARTGQLNWKDTATLSAPE